MNPASTGPEFLSFEQLSGRVGGLTQQSIAEQLGQSHLARTEAQAAAELFSGEYNRLLAAYEARGHELRQAHADVADLRHQLGLPALAEGEPDAADHEEQAGLRPQAGRHFHEPPHAGGVAEPAEHLSDEEQLQAHIDAQVAAASGTPANRATRRRNRAPRK